MISHVFFPREPSDICGVQNDHRLTYFIFILLIFSEPAKKRWLNTIFLRLVSNKGSPKQKSVHINGCIPPIQESTCIYHFILTLRISTLQTNKSFPGDGF